MHIFNLTIIFISGLCVGSFVNVVIDRLPKGKSITFDRSYCDHCKHTLAWYDLIPVISFFCLGRRCRYCHKKISWQYPIVETTTGILFTYSYSSTQGEPLRVTSPVVSLSPLYFPEAIFLFIVISGLIVIFFTDLKYRIIPDQILIFLTLTTTSFLFLFDRNEFISHLIAGAIFSLIFLLLVIITRGRGMGLGDVKFAFVIGFLLGFPQVVVAFYLSFLTGAAVSLILIIVGKKTMKSTIPFGPFLAGATVASLSWGHLLWNIFRKIIGI